MAAHARRKTKSVGVARRVRGGRPRASNRKRQPPLKRIQNHPRARAIRTSRSAPNPGIAARPIRAIRSARASSSVLVRLAGERIPPSRARRRPVASSPVSIPRAHLGQQTILRQQLRDIRRQHHVSAIARARAVVSSVSQRSFRRVSFRSFPASPVVVVARRARAAPVLVHVVVVLFAVLNLRHRSRARRSIAWGGVRRRGRDSSL